MAYVSTAAQWAKLAPEAASLAENGLAAVLSHEPLAGDAVPAGVRAATVAGTLCEPGALELAPKEMDTLVTGGRGEDPFLLLFTRGTTGDFKGVRLPQRAMIHAIEGGWASTGCTTADEGLHFLPFAHVAGQDQFMLALAQGHGLIMVSRREDTPRGLALGPTHLFSVPFLYDRIPEEVQARAACRPAPVRALVRAALGAGTCSNAGRRPKWSGSTATPPPCACELVSCNRRRRGRPSCIARGRRVHPRRSTTGIAEPRVSEMTRSSPRR